MDSKTADNQKVKYLVVVRAVVEKIYIVDAKDTLEAKDRAYEELTWEVGSVDDIVYIHATPKPEHPAT